MTHPMIERRKKEVWKKLEEAQALYEAACEADDDLAAEHWGRQVDRHNTELDYLAMEAADPEAHGYH